MGILWVTCIAGLICGLYGFDTGYAGVILQRSGLCVLKLNFYFQILDSILRFYKVQTVLYLVYADGFREKVVNFTGNVLDFVISRWVIFAIDLLNM